MATTSNKFPPDVPKDWDEAQDEIGNAAEGLTAKAADLAARAGDTVKDGYYRAKDAIGDPGEAVREAGRYAQDGSETVIRAVERHPLVAFGLGALSVGLIAWASLRPSPPQWQPDYGRLRQLFSDYGGDDALKAGESAVKTGQGWLQAHSGQAQDYARDGGRYLARRTEREPLAAIVGIGLAVYVIGSLLSSGSSEPEPPRRRSSAKR
ncbi:hypothetical protein DWF00_28915 [Bosea caraganae]|uniref:CsbD family protein n=1 Tax=Bosea caraganae TaxID=2763117 RepID=A0A370L2V7_9HYPH|nr:hypothetical protein [Bosea caraganae]RDJ20955.1 hypothetical protein DWF00_28915 [Bosea caraganae]RDJ22511.1 hypothetical protein DWE98_18910 [Bosea caraganae]